MFDEDGNEKASDVVVTISKFEAENTQAITVKIASATLKMDQEAVFNVAKAGENRYTFGNGSAAAARNTGGVIEGNDLTVYTSLSSKFKFNATSSAKRCIHAVTVSASCFCNSNGKVLENLCKARSTLELF